MSEEEKTQKTEKVDIANVEAFEKIPGAGWNHSLPRVDSERADFRPQR